jgi:hypothetical protein
VPVPFLFGQRDVCFWHKADIQLSAGNVRFWGNSGHQSVPMSAFDPQRTFLSAVLITHSRTQAALL